MRETGRRERERRKGRERKEREGWRKEARETEFSVMCCTPDLQHTHELSKEREEGKGKGTDGRDGKRREGRRKGWQRMKMWGEGEKKRGGVREGF